MKCPKCNEQPITLFNFILKSFPNGIKCKSCGADLILGKLLVRGLYGSYAIGVVFALTFIAIMKIYNLYFGTYLWILVVAVMITGIPIEYFLWTRGNFEEKIE